MSSVIFTALERQRQQRLDQAENSARTAVYTCEYVTRGAGQYVDPTPVLFGIDFLEPPKISTGVMLSQVPDPDLWLYPLTTTGVVRWLTRPRYAPSVSPLDQQSTGPSTASVYYIGAYLFTVTRIDPIYTQRTDGSNRDYWAQQVQATTPGTTERAIAEQQLAEADFALRLTNEPPQCVIKHYFRFEALALKLAGDVVSKADAPLPPRAP